MGNKDKGRVGENQVCDFINERSKAEARRVPLSGSLAESEMFKEFSDDIDIILPDGTKKKGEVKLRKAVPKTIYNWLKVKISSGVMKVKYLTTKEHEKPPNYLFMRRDNSPWLVCMTIDEFLELVNKTEVE